MVTADVAVPAAPRRRSASAVVVRYSARRSLRSGLLWGYVFGVTVASSALSYSRIYATPADRRRLAATFGSNHAASALFGPAPQLETAPGFTAFKVSMTLTVVGAVWGILTSTRLLRGDEDAGRWDLLLAGRTTRGGAVAQVLAGLGTGVAALWAVTAAVTVVVGRASTVGINAPGGLYLALSLVAAATMFLAVGACTSQLAGSRRQAAGYAGAFLAVAYGIRMVGDAGTGASWLVWLSPLGWVEELRPLTDPQPWALAPIAALTLAAAGGAVAMAGRRDVGSGLVPERGSRPPRLRGLSGPTALTVRLTGPSVAWWAAGMAVAGLLMGIVARAAGGTVAGSSVQEVFARLGAPGSGATAFLGVAFLVLAIVLALQAASQVGAARDEEADGRLDHLLAAPVGRRRWLGGRLAAGCAAIAGSGLAGGLAAWVGTVTQGAGPSLATTLAAGVNTVPPALVVLGAGVLALGYWPRRAVAVAYAVLGWSVLVTLVGGFFGQDRWVLDTSLLHQMASAPAVPPDWRADAVMVGLAVGAMLAGVAGFRRRDLRGA